MSQEPITGIDHALIGVRDLEAARETWMRLGFTVSPRGRHIGWGTANYCIMFQRDYIELLGIVDPDQFTNDLDRFLEQREGALGLAFATGDAVAAAAELTARGIAVDGPKDLKRILELPEGDALPAFSLVHLPPEAVPGLKAFLCQHLSRDLVWQPQWTAHPNTALGIRRVTVAVEDPEATARAYAEIWGRDVDVFLAKPEAADLLFGGVPATVPAPRRPGLRDARRSALHCPSGHRGRRRCGGPGMPVGSRNSLPGRGQLGPASPGDRQRGRAQLRRGLDQVRG